ncbi:acyl-CoA carboxylase subunit epsilon [Kitasatospora fiedleri]|uniref:acyl-CoA carboxylase subunit epsilon n=1 Tax=Kitasatospora fiedleri TaxID=2991545 RepID=UPI002499E50A|nr:acyl-CoA carboxylase subunit epsilon [Kitasatospora fiedleri]
MSPIQVLHGQPTPEELATVLAVVQSRAATGAAAAPAAGPATAWTTRTPRTLPAPGPHAWRTSLWPR